MAVELGIRTFDPDPEKVRKFGVGAIGVFVSVEGVVTVGEVVTL
jgi:hypothetical protein